jgi:hypothetical protein
VIAGWLLRAARRVRALGADESGTISIATVFAIMFLTILLGMVINSGRQADSKIKLQTAADAATLSGGTVLARGMNTLAFTNHLLCETFALTAFFREARDRHAEQLVPEVLAAWDRIGPVLADSGFEKFERLGQAIPQKTPLEQEMVRSYSDWAAASGELVLPVLEEILATEAIPQLQREIVQQVPHQAQTAVLAVASRYGQRVSERDASRGPLVSVLWRTLADPVGGDLESVRRTLPVVDPASDEAPRLARAIEQRNRLARHYLAAWNNDLMRPFDQEARMSQFGRLWRSFTCGQLEQLLGDHASRNLPHLIRETPDEVGDTQQWLALDYQFVGVAYWRKLPAAIPRLFGDSLAADHQAFAQGQLFLRRPRLVRHGDGWDWGNEHHIRLDNSPRHWDLWNQNWTFQLVPATADSLAAILSQTPRSSALGDAAGSLRVPDLGGVNPGDLRRVVTH